MQIFRKMIKVDIEGFVPAEKMRAEIKKSLEYQGCECQVAQADKIEFKWKYWYFSPRRRSMGFVSKGSFAVANPQSKTTIIEFEYLISPWIFVFFTAMLIGAIWNSSLVGVVSFLALGTILYFLATTLTSGYLEDECHHIYREFTSKQSADTENLRERVNAWFAFAEKMESEVPISFKEHHDSLVDRRLISEILAKLWNTPTEISLKLEIADKAYLLQTEQTSKQIVADIGANGDFWRQVRQPKHTLSAEAPLWKAP